VDAIEQATIDRLTLNACVETSKRRADTLNGVVVFHPLVFAVATLSASLSPVIVHGWRPGHAADDDL
jgi:hypothetical protein